MAEIKVLEEKFGEKPISELVYEDANAKVVRFYLRKEQEVKPHTSPSSVFITVLKGRLLFTSEKGETEVSQGSTVFYRPNELHGFKAIEDSIVEATITPNPAVRRI